MTRRLFPVLLAACALLAPGFARAADGLVENRDFVTIAGGQPLAVEAGKIEVVEVFGYWCHVCNDFQPQLSAWERKLAPDVAFRYLPAAFTLADTYARAYFAAESLGALARTHEPTYHAIHAEQSLPSRGASVDEIARLYGGFGLEPAAVAREMRSPAADARMEAARAFIVATGVQGTPSIIVNGRYRVIGRSFGDMLRITDLLVARERAAGPRNPSVSAPHESKP